MATEPLRTMNRAQLKAHKHRLGVREYEQYHQVRLSPILIKQYHVPSLPYMLLSQRSRKVRKGWIACGHCCSALRAGNRSSTKPPKFAIANGFAIGEFPEEIKRVNPTSRHDKKRKINIEDVSGKLRALVAPTRPYGCVFAYSGGSHKSIQGNFQFFETEQSHVGGVIDHVRSMGVAQNMYVMLCGRMTPAQRIIVRNCAQIDTEVYRDVLNYFIKESGHLGYAGWPCQRTSHLQYLWRIKKRRTTQIES